MPDIEKIELVDSILTQLDRLNPKIDRIWADEARNRWQAYKAGKLEMGLVKKMMMKVTYDLTYVTETAKLYI